MHIPDGFLDTRTWVSLGAASALAVCYAVRRTRQAGDEKTIPLMGVTAAFIFAAQMINVPVAGGTSGHFMGGVLAAILLGPWTGLLIMASILIVQCLLFQDGGVTALGANIFNMGVIGSVGGYYLYECFRRATGSSAFSKAGASAAAGASIVLAATACAAELSFSGTVPFRVVVPMMAASHALVGIGEGIVTALVLVSIEKTRPDLLRLERI